MKFIPYQYKRLLIKDILSARAPLPRENALFFRVLCSRGDLPSSALG